MQTLTDSVTAHKQHEAVAAAKTAQLEVDLAVAQTAAKQAQQAAQQVKSNWQSAEASLQVEKESLQVAMLGSLQQSCLTPGANLSNKG